MTRQGVHWRFWRLFNDIYVSAFETILFIEKVFGAELREHAIRISKERYALRQEAISFQSADALLKGEEGRQRSHDAEGPRGGKWQNPQRSTSATGESRRSRTSPT